MMKSPSLFSGCGREGGGRREEEGGRRGGNIPCNSLAVAMNVPCATSHSNASKLDAVFVDQCFVREEKRRVSRREEGRKKRKRQRRSKSKKKRKRKRKRKRRRKRGERNEKRRGEREDKRKERKREEKREEEREGEKREERRERRKRVRKRERQETETPVCRFKTPPCVRSGRLRVYRQQARMFNTKYDVLKTHGETQRLKKEFRLKWAMDNLEANTEVRHRHARDGWRVDQVQRHDRTHRHLVFAVLPRQRLHAELEPLSGSQG